MLIALSEIVRCDTDVPLANGLVQLGALINPFVLRSVVRLDDERRRELFEFAAPVLYDGRLVKKLRRCHRLLPNVELLHYVITSMNNASIHDSRGGKTYGTTIK